ncbi:hypothetical protein P2G88_12700 [Aliiglaciecola sp. CAU 1673]|uniref:hypothetical protein n=1 Tax=Aliiglaciecola sp. CAU 1673 TaxID=3032595 RepID=UPI0023DAE58D|nr:hypothetical protein [Aliiglaciecola sp. CAU 1673]MDF2179111.1 hypothetical protein [Aliiglaciecola sp. CAU 1673]
MSDLMHNPVNFGCHPAMAAIEQNICDLKARIALCNELIREEPEFKYQHELERDWLLRQVFEQNFRLSKFEFQVRLPQ